MQLNVSIEFYPTGGLQFSITEPVSNERLYNKCFQKTTGLKRKQINGMFSGRLAYQYSFYNVAGMHVTRMEGTPWYEVDDGWSDLDNNGWNVTDDMGRLSEEQLTEELGGSLFLSEVNRCLEIRPVLFFVPKYTQMQWSEETTFWKGTNVERNEFAAVAKWLPHAIATLVVSLLPTLVDRISDFCPINRRYIEPFKDFVNQFPIASHLFQVQHRFKMCADCRGSCIFSQKRTCWQRDHHAWRRNEKPILEFIKPCMDADYLTQKFYLIVPLMFYLPKPSFLSVITLDTESVLWDVYYRELFALATFTRMEHNTDNHDTIFKYIGAPEMNLFGPIPLHMDLVMHPMIQELRKYIIESGDICHFSIQHLKAMKKYNPFPLVKIHPDSKVYIHFDQSI
jgi:hypothetical protein